MVQYNGPWLTDQCRWTLVQCGFVWHISEEKVTAASVCAEWMIVVLVCVYLIDTDN